MSGVHTIQMFGNLAGADMILHVLLMVAKASLERCGG